MNIYRGGSEGDEFPLVDSVDLNRARAEKGAFLLGANISSPKASERKSEVLIEFTRADVPALLDLVKKLVAQVT